MSSNIPKDKNCVSLGSPQTVQLCTGMETKVDTDCNATTLINQQRWEDYNDQLPQVEPMPLSGNSNMSSTGYSENMWGSKMALDSKQTLQTNSTVFQGFSNANRSQALQTDQVQTDKTNPVLDPIINNELNQQSTLYRNVQQQVQSQQQGQLMRQQMEQLQQLMEQQQKLIRLLSWPKTSQGLQPGISALIQPSCLSVNEDSSNINAQGSFCVPLVQVSQSTEQLTSSISVNNNYLQSAIHPHLSQDPEESIPEVGNCSGNLSPINEERDDQGGEQRAVTPFGIKRNSKRMGRLEERPIRPGIDEMQKTFEDFVEEQLKVDAELLQQDSQDINEVKMAPKKSFLKCGEGIARFEKNKENVLKEQNKNSVHELMQQFPKQSRFSNQRRLSLPTFNEKEKLQVKKQSVLSKQGHGSDLVTSKTNKLFSTSSFLTNIKKKDHIQKEKQDEIKNSTDEGIQSDINVAELATKGESIHKHTNDRNGGNQQMEQEKKTGDLSPLEESQGRNNVRKYLNLSDLERQQLTGVDSQSQNQTSNNFSHGNGERQNQDQEIGQSVENQLQQCSNDQPFFNNTPQLECLSLYKPEALNQSPELTQAQLEKAQNKNSADIKEPRKMLDGKDSNIGFKKVNDRIVQVTSDNGPYHSANFRNWENKNENMHGFSGYNLCKRGLLQNNIEHCEDCSIRAHGLGPESNSLKSKLQQSSTEEILHNFPCTGKSLDMSDDADYASDGPSGVEEMGMAFQTSQHFTCFKSSAGMPPVKCNSLSSSNSSENEPSEHKSPLSKRYPLQYNRPLRNKNKTTRRKSSSSKKIRSSFMKNQMCGTTESELVQSSAPVLADKLSPALNYEPNVSTISDLSQQMKTNSLNVQGDAQSRQLQDKLLQLETEIDRFKAENTALAKLKERQELAMENLRKRMDQFEHEKTEKVILLEAYKKEELKKLKDERKLSEKSSRAKAAFDRRDREEIELLKKQLDQLQEDFKNNESRWSLGHNYLWNHINTLTKENFELRDELKAVECHQQESVKRNKTAGLINSKFETPVSKAISTDTSQTVQWSHRSRSSTPTGRRMPLERSQTLENTELKLSEKVVKSAEIQKRPLQEIQERSSVHLRSRSTPPTGQKTPSQDRSTIHPKLVSEAISRDTTQTVQWSHRSRSSTPTGRRMPLERSQTPVITELKNIQQPMLNHQKGHERKLSASSLNQSVFQRANAAGCARDVQSSTSGNSENNSCMHLQTTEHLSMDRSQSYTTKQQVLATKPLNRSVAETPSRLQERPPSGHRSRSATRSGRKTFLDGRQIGFDVEQVSCPSSVLLRRENSHLKSNATQDDIREEIRYPDGKMEQLLTNGNRIITFRNDTRKEVSADGQSVTITLFNGDVKQFLPDQRVIYYYADAKTIHTTFPNGTEMFQFPNNQIEKHYPDGKKEIIFPDQTVKHLYPDGREKSIFPDGTIVSLKKNGDKIIEFNNGQREVHTLQYKRREYPNGTIKTVYSNGRQETKYSTGRVRIKDREGNIILDKK
ncbi:centromere protein J-like isoform X3 [Narcine bancroftii]|uniref:centromere protein J-like isoform X3 n=1 Tax=Narcine bancroftii TaxID=1343680 RepID=UPI003831F199